MRSIALVSAVLVLGCGSEQAPAKKIIPWCDLSKPFGAPQPIMELNTADGLERLGSLTADELTIYFERAPLERWSGPRYETYVSTRARRTDPFGPPVIAADLIGVSHPVITADSLTMYSITDGKISLARRANTLDPFPRPTPIAGLSSSWYGDPKDLFATLDGTGLYYAHPVSGRLPLGGHGYPSNAHVPDCRMRSERVWV